MDTAYRRCPNTNSVNSTVSDATLAQQRKETDVSPTIMTSVKVSVGCLGNKAETIDLEKFRQIVGALATEIERRSLNKTFRLWSISKPGGSANGFFSRGKVMVQQPSRSNKSLTIVVETIDSHIRRKVFGRIPNFHVQAQQLSNRISVFPRIKSAQNTMGA